jgi:hypothetical protein
MGSNIRRSIIYIEGESILALGNASINYERILRPEYNNLQVSIKGGVGMFYWVEMEGWFSAWTMETSKGLIWKLSSFLILGKHFEIGLGISLLNCTTCSNYWDSASRIYPIISLGFRMGNHRPEFIKIHLGSYGMGLGIGYAF